MSACILLLHTIIIMYLYVHLYVTWGGIIICTLTAHRVNQDYSLYFLPSLFLHNPLDTHEST